jgi:hypothetical protein
MNHNPNHNQVKRNDHVGDNDNDRRGDKVIAPTPTGSAIASSASLQALTAALNGVDMTAVAGRSTIPMIGFKRDGDGTWAFGRQQTLPEDASLWAVNVRSFKRGYICFNDANKVVDERLAPITQPMPDVTALPDHGFRWQEQWSVALKCTDGADAGIEVVYKPTTVGGIQAVAGMIEAVRDRLNSGMHDGKIAPIVRLDKDSYQHSQYGRVYTPLLTVVDWMSLEGPAPAPAPAPAPTGAPLAGGSAAGQASISTQPRRRRVG